MGPDIYERATVWQRPGKSSESPEVQEALVTPAELFILGTVGLI